jgi:hypothetical protein
MDKNSGNYAAIANKHQDFSRILTSMDRKRTEIVNPVKTRIEIPIHRSILARLS